MVIDFEKDMARVYGKNIKLERTRNGGHYYLQLRPGVQVDDDSPVNDMESCFISIDSDDLKEVKEALRKLHLQMGHLPIEKLIKTSGKCKPEMAALIESIRVNCLSCQKFAKSPAKPIVALARAERFNEVLSLDLKVWRGKLILYMIDQWSRLTRGIFIKSKKPAEVVEGVWTNWISIGFGVPKCLHSDVGGEFTNEEIGEVADKVGCKVSATAGYAPHQNGLNERNHAVVDSCLNKIKADYPNMKDEMILAHALFAKNSLQMTYGYSSLQLVLGQNPNLPNIMNATPPMLEEGVPEGNVLRNHLNALHAARTAFIKSEVGRGRGYNSGRESNHNKHLDLFKKRSRNIFLFLCIFDDFELCFNDFLQTHQSIAISSSTCEIRSANFS